MAAPAPSLRAKPNSRRRPLTITRPQFALQTIENPRKGFLKDPVDEYESIMRADIAHCEESVLRWLVRWTRGGWFEDERPTENGRERPRPRVVGPKIDTDPNTQKRRIFGVRERLCLDTGWAPTTIDKALKALKDFGVIEILEEGSEEREEQTGNDGRTMWIAYWPEKLGQLPRREYVPRMPAGSEEDASSQEDEQEDAPPRQFEPASIPPIQVAPRRKTKWIDCGNVPMRIENRRDDEIIIGAELEERGLLIVIAGEQTSHQNLQPSARGPQAVENGNGYPNLQLSRNASSENKRLARTFASLGPLSQAAFEQIVGIIDRCGIESTWEEIEEAKTHWLAYDEQTHLKIQADACVRECESWNKPRFTPRLPAYLNPKGKKLWDTEPIKPRTSPDAKKQVIDWDRMAAECNAAPLPGRRRK